MKPSTYRLPGQPGRFDKAGTHGMGGSHVVNRASLQREGDDWDDVVSRTVIETEPPNERFVRFLRTGSLPPSAVPRVRSADSSTTLRRLLNVQDV